MHNFDVGREVVWRSLPGGQVGTVIAAFVVEDGDEARALFQPEGAPRLRRAGLRGGPRGRQLLPDGRGSKHVEAPFRGPSVVRVQPRDQAFSVIREWHGDGPGFSGWYVNLEQAWRRTPIGFDSRDDILDIAVADDLSSWSWKDRDELDWAVNHGSLSQDDAGRIEEAGNAAAALLTARQWPFDDASWARWAPDSGWGLPRLPDGWADAF